MRKVFILRDEYGTVEAFGLSKAKEVIERCMASAPFDMAFLRIDIGRALRKLREGYCVSFYEEDSLECRYQLDILTY